NVTFGIGFGFGNPYGPGFGVYDGGFDGGYMPRPRRHHRWNDYAPVREYSGVSCATGANIVRSSGFRGVEAYDCSAPVYSYQAWKRGEQFDIRVSARGRIISVQPTY
ncbi:MAG: hypothetical protein KGO94_08010, partial [Alphaproteobacteria bacterium]|nr:hypothetical protein [Alphaproteobacteria bacterium]